MPPSVKQPLLCYIMIFPLLCALALSSCGKIGDPIPPDIVFPQAITDRTAQVEKKNDCLNYCSEKSKTVESNFQEKE
jgi:hypothetical protein